jgi:hypothetical protein
MAEDHPAPVPHAHVPGDKDDVPAPPRPSSSSTSPMRPVAPPPVPDPHHAPPHVPPAPAPAPAPPVSRPHTYKFAVDAKVRRAGFDSPLHVLRHEVLPDGTRRYVLEFWHAEGQYPVWQREFVALEDELQAWKDA